MNTNIVLKYRRPCDCWVCPDCEMENGMELGNCSFCGAPRSYSAPILKRWNPADDAPPIYDTPRTMPTYTGAYSAPTRPTTPTYTGGYDSSLPRPAEPSSDSSGGGVVALVIILGVVFLVFIFAVLLAAQ